MTDVYKLSLRERIWHSDFLDSVRWWIDGLTGHRRWSVELWTKYEGCQVDCDIIAIKRTLKGAKRMVCRELDMPCEFVRDDDWEPDMPSYRPDVKLCKWHSISIVPIHMGGSWQYRFVASELLAPCDE
jgi:hypothetical protein